MTLKVTFLDSGREPRVNPNPAFPDGMDIDLAKGAKGCKADLPYPAPRCGMMYIECDVCKTNAAITVAGRRDDPRTVILPCKRLDA